MNVGIAGAGLVGRLMAWQLLRQGHQVTLFDRDTKEGEASAAWVAAAMLAPFSEGVKCEKAVFDWGIESLKQWPNLLQQLASDTGNITPFQQRGSLVVAHKQDHSNLEYFNRLLFSQLTGYESSIECLHQAELQAIEPELASTFSQATFLRDEGCIDNWCLLNNLTSGIITLGATWYSQVNVTHIEPGVICIDEFSMKRQSLNQQEFLFDWVIDTRGFGAKERLTNFRGVRGEVLWVQACEVNLSRPVRLMHPRYQLYIAPKPDNIYVIGATEIESESLAPITVRSSLELQSALYSVHSGFAEANVLKAYANCRPAYMDNLPRIDIEPCFMTINGLYRHGYLLSPVVVQAALNALENKDDEALVYRK